MKTAAVVVGGIVIVGVVKALRGYWGGVSLPPAPRD